MQGFAKHLFDFPNKFNRNTKCMYFYSPCFEKVGAILHLPCPSGILWFCHYTPGIYAEGYIVFIFPFVRTYVRSFICSFVRTPSRSWNYFKVLRASNSSGVYLTNHSSESIHIWTIGTLEGRLSFHDSSPQGPCPGVGLEVKI